LLIGLFPLKKKRMLMNVIWIILKEENFGVSAGIFIPGKINSHH